jgi:hypothetical protein
MKPNINNMLITTSSSDPVAVDQVCDIVANYAHNNRFDIMPIPKGCEFFPQIKRKLAEKGITGRVVSE